MKYQGLHIGLVRVYVLDHAAREPIFGLGIVGIGHL
jgi:hypothetical protein